jgi:hypothetical protein
MSMKGTKKPRIFAVGFSLQLPYVGRNIRVTRICRSLMKCFVNSIVSVKWLFIHASSQAYNNSNNDNNYYYLKEWEEWVLQHMCFFIANVDHDVCMENEVLT